METVVRFVDLVTSGGEVVVAFFHFDVSASGCSSPLMGFVNLDVATDNCSSRLYNEYAAGLLLFDVKPFDGFWLHFPSLPIWYEGVRDGSKYP
jgi:hypothetical protein